MQKYKIKEFSYIYILFIHKDIRKKRGVLRVELENGDFI